MRRAADIRQANAADSTWWRNAVFYQVYVRSFADGNGDGVGDLAGIRSRLGYLELLGVDAVWLTPFYASPMADHGYDVADPRSVDPLFGDLAAFDALLADAHTRGIRVVVDLVPNHTSSAHRWFRAALGSGGGSVERDRYVFRQGRGAYGELPPNNWTSVFGGPAWTQISDGNWYLHLFAPEQPDLNWGNPDVRSDLEQTMRFWLDRGVDGFRIDVAHGMSKPPGLPDADAEALHITGFPPEGLYDPRFDDDGVHDIHRMIRKVLDEYPDRVLVGEIWVADDHRFARYLRWDELHLGFNFRLAEAAFDGESVRVAIERSIGVLTDLDSPPTWTLSNHDISREVTRYGGGRSGAARARAMLLVQMALPGAVFVYNGEELGLPDAELPDWALQDPIWRRSGYTERGRDACRVPLPWQGDAPPFGFTAGPSTWLPMPAHWSVHSVENQLEDEASMLSLYRAAIELRAGSPAFSGPELEWYGAPPGCFAFRRKGGGLICALNTASAPVPLPPGDVLLASGPLRDRNLPPETAVWLV